MKKLLFITALLCAVLCSSCGDEYDDSALRNDLNSLEARVAKLEEMCKQMNTNISSLQSIVNALQNNDYVTGVTPITKNGEEIGYTITFSKSKPITIYHGEDGADGKDGNSVAPVIGVKKHTDGIYYWTLNGEWLTDANGNKIKAQGADGTDGTNGDDGVTPKLKIEDDYWYVSYDNGKTWEEVGKATGEDGADGTNGDSIFTTIDTSSSSDYVIFTLSDGSQIKLPTWAAFEVLRTQCNQMNTNIQSLQALINVLESHDYIQSVTPLMENGTQVGYTITFAYSNPITIYSNASGSAAPVIGVKKDADNVYYWTLNGEWVLDDEGNKIKAEGKDGSNGTNGSDGTNGEDGITPKLKIEEGYWYVSYDNGTSWTKLGKATGADGADGSDGADGTDGEDGDNIFSSVTQDEKYVYFNLADGTIIILPKQDKENIQFEDLRVKMLCCTRGADRNNDGEISYSEAAAISSISTVFKGNTDIVAFNELRYFTGLTEINDSAFAGCTNLWKITLPETINRIGEYAFDGCSHLRSIVIPKMVNTIGAYAFRDCIRLQSEIIIPDGVTSIQKYTFSGCTKLSSVIIPNSVTSLEMRCFQNCIFSSFTIPASVTKVTGASVPGADTLYIKSTTPPTAVSPTYAPWSICADEVGIIYVPIGSGETYKTSTKWKDYKDIINEFDFE